MKRSRETTTTTTAWCCCPITTRKQQRSPSSPATTSGSGDNSSCRDEGGQQQQQTHKPTATRARKGTRKASYRCCYKNSTTSNNSKVASPTRKKTPKKTIDNDEASSVSFTSLLSIAGTRRKRNNNNKNKPQQQQQQQHAVKAAKATKTRIIASSIKVIDLCSSDDDDDDDDDVKVKKKKKKKTAFSTGDSVIIDLTGTDVDGGDGDDDPTSNSSGSIPLPAAAAAAAAAAASEPVVLKKAALVPSTAKKKISKKAVHTTTKSHPLVWAKQDGGKECYPAYRIEQQKGRRLCRVKWCSTGRVEDVPSDNVSELPPSRRKKGKTGRENEQEKKLVCPADEEVESSSMLPPPVITIGGSINSSPDAAMGELSLHDNNHFTQADSIGSDSEYQKPRPRPVDKNANKGLTSEIVPPPPADDISLSDVALNLYDRNEHEKLLPADDNVADYGDGIASTHGADYFDDDESIETIPPAALANEIDDSTPCSAASFFNDTKSVDATHTEKPIEDSNSNHYLNVALAPSLNIKTNQAATTNSEVINLCDDDDDDEDAKKSAVVDLTTDDDPEIPEKADQQHLAKIQNKATNSPPLVWAKQDGGKEYHPAFLIKQRRRVCHVKWSSTGDIEKVPSESISQLPPSRRRKRRQGKDSHRAAKL